MKIRYVSVDDIKNSLHEKIKVGFDIDDTLFASYGVFLQIFKVYDTSWDEYYDWDGEIWDQINCMDAKFSIPKQSAKDLIKMHQDRGDEICFLTSRFFHQKETLSQTISKTFNIPNTNKVIFANDNKLPYLQTMDLQIYYGDVDGDIKLSQQCNIRPIRVLQSPKSISQKVNIGAFDEEVLLGSQL